MSETDGKPDSDRGLAKEQSLADLEQVLGDPSNCSAIATRDASNRTRPGLTASARPRTPITNRPPACSMTAREGLTGPRPIRTSPSSPSTTPRPVETTSRRGSTSCKRCTTCRPRSSPSQPVPRSYSETHKPALQHPASGPKPHYCAPRRASCGPRQPKSAPATRPSVTRTDPYRFTRAEADQLAAEFRS